MVGAACSTADHRARGDEQRIGDGSGGGGAADLIGDDGQAAPLRPQPQHGFHEIRTMGRDDPGRAQDEMWATRRPHTHFAREFAAPVSAQRGGRVVWGKGLVPRTIEHVIGGEVQERQPPVRRRAGHRGGRIAVHHHGRVKISLGLVDGGPGGGVDHRIGIGAVDGQRAGGRVGQIGPVAAQGHQRHPRRHPADQLPRHLPGLAEDQKLHALVPNRSPTPLRANSGCHQAALSRYQRTVRRRPSSSVTDGRQPSSSRMRVGSMA